MILLPFYQAEDENVERDGHQYRSHGASPSASYAKLHERVAGYPGSGRLLWCRLPLYPHEQIAPPDGFVHELCLARNARRSSSMSGHTAPRAMPTSSAGTSGSPVAVAGITEPLPEATISSPSTDVEAGMEEEAEEEGGEEGGERESLSEREERRARRRSEKAARKERKSKKSRR